MWLQAHTNLAAQTKSTLCPLVEIMYVCFTVLHLKTPGEALLRDLCLLSYYYFSCSTFDRTFNLGIKDEGEGGGSKGSVSSWLTLNALEPRFCSPNAGHQSSDSLSRSFFSAAPLPYHSRKMDGVIPSTRLRFWLLDPPRSSVIIVVINGPQSGDQLHEVGAIGRFLKQPCISDFKTKKK